MFKNLVMKLQHDVVITIWKTFLQDDKFYNENYENVVEYINCVDKSKNKRLINISNKLQQLKLNLEKVTNYHFLVNNIDILESINLKIIDQINVIESIRYNTNINDIEINQKLEKLIEKKSFYSELLQHVKECQNNQSPNQEILQITNSFLRLNSSDVERTFNTLLNLQSIRATNLTQTNINNIMFIRCNIIHFIKEKSEDNVKRRIKGSSFGRMINQFVPLHNHITTNSFAGNTECNVISNISHTGCNVISSISHTGCNIISDVSHSISSGIF